MTATPLSRVMGILGQRLVQALVVALLVAGLCFLMVQSLPGDIAFRIAAGRYGYDYVTAEAANAVRSELGLAGSALARFGDWLWALLQGNLGSSLVTGAPVATDVGHHLGATLTLASASVVLALAVAFAKLALLKSMNVLLADWLSISLFAALTVLKKAGSMIFWVLLIRAILSWVSQGRNPIEYVMHQLTEPFLAPIRRVLPALGGLDLSVLVAFIGLQAINYLLGDLFGQLWWMI